MLERIVNSRIGKLGLSFLAAGIMYGCSNVQATPTINPTPVIHPTATATYYPIETQVIVPIETPETPTQEPEKVPIPEDTPTPSPTPTPTPYPIFTPTHTPTLIVPTSTPTIFIPTPTHTPTPFPTPSPTPTPTPYPTPTNTPTPSPTPTPTYTPTPTSTPTPVPETAQTYALSKNIPQDLVSMLSATYDKDNILTKYEKNVIDSIAANTNLQNKTTIETILPYNQKLISAALTLEEAKDGIATLEDTLNAVSVAFEHKPLAERLMLNLEDTEGAWSQQDIRALIRIYPLINPEKIIDFNAINEIMAGENVGFVYSEPRVDVFEVPTRLGYNEDGTPKTQTIKYTLNVHRTDVIPTLAHVLWTQYNGQAVVDIQDITEPEHIDGLVSSYWPANPGFHRTAIFHTGSWIGQVIDEQGNIISAYTAAKFMRDNPNLETVSGVSKDVNFLYKMTDFMRLTFGHLTGDDRYTPEEMLSRMDKNGFFRGGSPEQVMTAVAIARAMGIPALNGTVDSKATAFFPFSNMGQMGNIIYDANMSDEPVTALLLDLDFVKAMTQPVFAEYTKSFGPVISIFDLLALRNAKGLYPPYFFPSQN